MIKITCYCRINFGLIDLSEKPYRIDGSHGIYTNLVLGEVEMKTIDTDCDIIDTNDSNIKRYKQVILNCKQYIGKYTESIYIKINNLIGVHKGVGSGTQLSMAIVECFNQTYDLNLSIDQKAFLALSGGTSSIGVYCFSNGGYLVDAGRLYPKEKNIVGPGEIFCFDSLPPLVTRIEAPSWYVCILIPQKLKEINGDDEKNLFDLFTPIPNNQVNEICMWILKGIIPSITTNNIYSFGFCIEKIMSLGFKKKEIDTRGTVISDRIRVLKRLGLKGVGMSSFGPTVFGFIDNDVLAKKIYDDIYRLFYNDKVYLTTIRNKGADIVIM